MDVRERRRCASFVTRFEVCRLHYVVRPPFVLEALSFVSRVIKCYNRVYTLVSFVTPEFSSVYLFINIVLLLFAESRTFVVSKTLYETQMTSSPMHQVFLHLRPSRDVPS